MPARIPMALATLSVWALLTLFGMRWAHDGSAQTLLQTVSRGVSWNLVMALAVLAAVTGWMKWADLRFGPPRPWSSLRVLWFPALYLIGFAVLAGVVGLPAGHVMLFVALNTALVGLSEEWMFRGVLFRALRTRLALSPAILITSALFGAVHLLNVFVTGRLFDAAVQATAAFVSGLLFMALLLRTGSIWVPVVYHALWDFGSFMVAAGQSATRAPPPDLSQGWAWAVPILLVLPNGVYAVYLLWGLREGKAGSA